ncbi:MAG: hypothetical protein P1V97_10315 [Planctomycetota bacterium]|nr:hypothetical protein [Planctomycetota bacterium]
MKSPHFKPSLGSRFLILLLTLLPCLSCTSQKAGRNPEPEPEQIPVIKQLDSLSRLLMTLHGRSRKDDALSRSCRDAWKSLDQRKTSKIWILNDPSPIALIHSEQVFFSRGLMGLIGRRSLAIDRQPFEPGRAIMALMAHMQAHLELHGKEGLLKVGGQCALSWEKEQALRAASVPVRTVSRLARSIRSFRSGSWPEDLCRQADTRALEILESQAIPGESLVEAYSALIPEEAMFGSNGASSVFKDRHPISPAALKALKERLKAGRSELSGRQIAKGRNLGLRAQNEGKRAELGRLWQRARVYERRGLKKEALEKTALGLRISPRNVALLTRFARLSLALKKDEDGEVYLRRALSIEPEYVPARVELAKLFLSRGWLEAAEADLRVGVELSPLYGPLYTVKAQVERQKKSESWGDYEAIGIALGHPFLK